MEEIRNLMKYYERHISDWVRTHYIRFGIFNILILAIVLLRSAGYFHPYFPITVNFIVLYGIVLSIILLHANSTSLLIVFMIFWIFAGLMKILQVDIWAERTGIYAFQALFIAISLFIIEYLFKKE